ncbi:single-stranded DNA-binding protein [Bifidobacterium catulorum]|uniref:Single-stranded DNA-binding protein n=1 Tax=Bifidobacterium catulorum TaxID=1630173 RepID=A0A2U2MUC3_9BIFI|nr:single-stranded DNA-binding protein [Bifidobacterium catulorum]PWG60478.1 hypothetical protein DF200_02460 [Bifidobacterium catulorum]
MAVNIAFKGNVGKDPETHTFNNGNTVTTFSVGVSQGYYDQQRQWVDQGTMWVTVECSPAASHELPWVHKGSKVLVTGLLSQRFYTRKDGTQGSELRVYAQALGFLHRKDDQPPASGFAGADRGQSQPQASGADPWGGAGRADGFGEPDF